MAIKDARTSQQLTQAQLAARADVSREWLIGVEQGSRPRAELTKILSVLRSLDLPQTVGATDAAVYSGDTPEGRGKDPSTDDITRRAMAAHGRRRPSPHTRLVLGEPVSALAAIRPC